MSRNEPAEFTLPRLADPAEVEIPRSMFLDGLDYNPTKDLQLSIVDDQRRVARARAGYIGTARRLIEDLSRALSAFPAADRQGLAAPSMDVVAAVSTELNDHIQFMARKVDNAEDRYEQAVIASAVDAQQLVTVKAAPATSAPTPAAVNAMTNRALAQRGQH